MVAIHKTSTQQRSENEPGCQRKQSKIQVFSQSRSGNRRLPAGSKNAAWSMTTAARDFLVLSLFLGDINRAAELDKQSMQEMYC